VPIHRGQAALILPNQVRSFCKSSSFSSSSEGELVRSRFLFELGSQVTTLLQEFEIGFGSFRIETCNHLLFLGSVKANRIQQSAQ
jgi:hypothetical protein